MSFNKLNTLLGWVFFLIAAFVYILCCEPTTGFWDCGEYISTSYKLQVGHPPGAPFFQLMAHFFSFFAFSNTKMIAWSINTMSALFSAATILFLFWTITYFARKLINSFTDNTPQHTTAQRIAIFGAGAVGALAYTFSDTFWFSAVEGEVYAMSSFFTAVTFWAILKWEEQSENSKANRWLILIAYLIGLSIGVHLLNLLAIPAIVFIIYFKRFKYSFKNLLFALFISIGLLAFILWGIIPYLLILAGKMDMFFVNDLSFPVGSGTLVHFGLLLLLLIGCIFYSFKKKKVILNNALLAFVFLLIGYSSFLIIVIRSNAETPINENKPKDTFALTSYLGREQYGQTPLLYGTYYNAPPIAYKNAEPTYAKQYNVISIKDKKIVASFFDEAEARQYLNLQEKKLFTLQTSYNIAFDGIGSKLEYPKEFYTFFPRMWSTQEQHVANYEIWGGSQGTFVYINGHELQKPTFSENMRFFLNYQVGYMYFRYFMWNFAGKFNDIQGHGDLQNGQWISGIPFIDQYITGTAESVPETMQNKGHNCYYLLPLLLGLMGCFFQLQYNAKNWLVIGLLFIFTGLAIVVYLNQAAYQPRERDYAYAASFYAFAIWIGLGVIAFYKLFSRFVKKKLSWLIGFSVLLCGCVPAIMATENWDDHDRSGRTVALDLAVNCLESCAPNAILFTNGDNETFPLWYAQEVEGIRTDVRVINLSLLNADWYIDNCKRKIYQSEKIPISFSKNQYIDKNREYILLSNSEETWKLQDALSFVHNDENYTMLNEQRKIFYLPTNKFVFNVDIPKAIKNCAIPERMIKKVQPKMQWKILDGGITKASLIQLDLLANLNWERPIYFLDMAPDTYAGLQNYLQNEGFAYRLVPVKTEIGNNNDSWHRKGYVNTDLMYHNVMNKFQWGNLSTDKIYLDETSMRTIRNFKEMFVNLSDALLEEGKRDSALAVLNKAMQVLPLKNIHYDGHNLNLALNFLKTDSPQSAEPILKELLKTTKQKLHYYFKMSSYNQSYFKNEIFENFNMISDIFNASTEFKLKNIYTESLHEYFSIAPSYLSYCERELSDYFANQEALNYFSDVTQLMESINFILQKSRDFKQMQVVSQAEKIMKSAIQQYNLLESEMEE